MRAIASERRGRCAKSTMAKESTLRFGAQTDEVTSLLRIVNMVRTGDAATRPEIGRVTGLGRGVVTQRVDHAIEMGYLEDGEFGPSSGGRAPRTLRFRGDRGRIVVCALGALHIHVGVALLDGDVLDQTHRTWDISRGPAETLDTALSMIDEVLARTADAPVWGIAVGVPGPVDFESGRPVAPPIMPGWNGFDVRRRFEERYDAPVWVDNDVNLLALGERARRRDEQPRPDLLQDRLGHRRRPALARPHPPRRERRGGRHRPRAGARTPTRCAAAARSDASRPSPAAGRSSATPTPRRRRRDRLARAAPSQTARDAHPRGDLDRGRERRRPRDLARPALGTGRRRVDRRARQHVQPRRRS